MHPIVLLIFLALLALFYYQYYSASHHRRIIPISVNFHFTRKCNYECGFCFHTAKTSHLPSLQDAKQALALLKNEGMRKLNFAGGEPLLYPRFLGELVRFCKEELKLESVSIVTNGSKVNERFLFKYHTFIDIIAVSCDSFDEKTNKRIGRGTGNHLSSVQNVAALCKKYNVRFKLNTVVNKFNYEEDMNMEIQDLAPFRWKCFQVLIVKGENNQYATPEALRDASDFMLTDEEFQRFCDAHSHNKCFVPEPNRLMASSYLILDEYLRFVDRGSPTKPIIEIGVQQALHDVKWDESGFKERGGVYDWSKDAARGERGDSCNGPERKDLDW